MKTGTTANWSFGTSAVDALERSPFHKITMAFSGTDMEQVESGSLFHDDFQSADWPSWLTFGTTGTSSVTRGGGTACFQSKAAGDRAYAITNATVGSPVPNSGKFVVRSKMNVVGTGNRIWLLDNWDYGSQPIPNALETAGRDPDIYFVDSTLNISWGGVLRASAPGSAGLDYISETYYNGTSAFPKLYGSTMGSIISGSYAKAFAASFFTAIGDPWTNYCYGTAFAKYLSIFKGTSIIVGSLGSGYVAQLYGTAGAVGSSQASGGTAQIAVGTLDPPWLTGYIAVFSGTDQGSQMGRYPSTGNGTFWGGDVYKKKADGDLDDISDDVTSISHRIEYEDSTTGITPSGAIAGDLDVSLATGSKYSYFNPSSPYHGVPRLNRAVDAYLGFNVSGTDQYLQQFAGETSSLSVSSRDGNTQFHCVDKAEVLRKKNVTLPLMADVKSDYLILAILAECGLVDWDALDIYTNFFCYFSNSPNTVNGIVPYWTRDLTYTTGKWGDANGAMSGWAYYKVSHDYFSQGCVSFWFYVNGINTTVLSILYDSDNYIEVAPYDDGLDVKTVINGSISYPVDAGGGVITTGWHHVAVTWSGTLATLNAYIDGVSVGTGTYIKPLGIVNDVQVKASVGTSYIDFLRIGSHMRTGKDIAQMYLCAEGQVSETISIEPGFNLIQYAYINERNAWDLIKEICQAEGASAYFDSDGKFHFENRYHLLGPPHNVSQKTISYDSDITDLNLSETSDSVVNKCVVKAAPLEKQSGSDIWNTSDAIVIPAFGTRVFWADLSDPAVGIDTTFTGTMGTGQSRFQACRIKWAGTGNQYVDQTGSVALFGTAFAQSVKILGTNKSRWPLYLAGTDFSPYVYVYGSSLRSFQGPTGLPRVYAVAEDSDSIAEYGEHTQEISNDFITNLDYAEYMSQYTVMTSKDPKPTIDSLTILADPRLEPGDRVTVVDSSGQTGINDDFWVLGIDSKQDETYMQDLRVAYAVPISFLILDHPTFGRLDCNVLAF